MPATNDLKTRCSWANGDLYIEYHDKEWGVPVHDDRHLFEMIILEGAQAGLSWITILKKRENYRKAFDHFDARKIAQYDARKIQKLLADPGIVRNRLKINATIQNAKAFLAVQKEFGSFRQIHLAIRRRQTDSEFVEERPDSGKDERVRRDEQGSVEARIQVRRLHDLLRVHASRGMVNDHTVDCFRYKKR